MLFMLLKKNKIGFLDKVKTVLANFRILKKKKFFLIIKINTNQIKYFLRNKDFENKNFLLKGNWDKKKLPIVQYKNYNKNYFSVYQIFKHKTHYTKTKEYEFKSKIILSGNKTTRNQTSIADLNRYFKNLLLLKKNILKKGYLSQTELKTNKFDEIGVVIGSNGEFIKLEDKFGGTHRFAIARIFKIKKIYVKVVGIHQKYINKLNTSKFKKLNKNLLFE